MKFVFTLWLGMVALVQAAGLDFKETLKEVNAPADVKTVVVDFDFKNNTKKPVSVTKYDSTCSCMSVKIKGGKLRYAPGESGVVRAEFDMGNFSGAIDKIVALWIDDNKSQKPTMVLTVRVHIPVLVGVEPKTVKWKLNGDGGAQTIRIEMDYTKPIHVKKVVRSNEQFGFDLKTIEHGKTYDLVVTPRDVTSPGLGIFRIETDCDIEKHRIQQVFAVVRKSTIREAGPKKP